MSIPTLEIRGQNRVATEFCYGYRRIILTRLGKRVKKKKTAILEGPKVNPYANHREIWLGDPNGYAVVIASVEVLNETRCGHKKCNAILCKLCCANLSKSLKNSKTNYF